ncbi:hypothetical protein Tco_1436539 [Tanacetum coccineum]
MSILHSYPERSSEKFDAKADDGYFLGYSLVSKAFKVFNTIRQQIKETFYITFDESTEAIMFSQPSVEDITIVESERLPTDEYFHAFEPSKRYQVNSDIFQYVQPYVRPKSTVTEADATTATPAPQDKWSRDKHIELVNIIGNPEAGMLIRHMAKDIGVASMGEFLFAGFLSEIEPKKVSGVLKHLSWLDAMQEKLNQFSRNKVWTLVPPLYGKTIIGSKRI